MKTVKIYQRQTNKFLIIQTQKNQVFHNQKIVLQILPKKNKMQCSFLKNNKKNKLISEIIQFQINQVIKTTKSQNSRENNGTLKTFSHVYVV